MYLLTYLFIWHQAALLRAEDLVDGVAHGALPQPDLGLDEPGDLVGRGARVELDGVELWEKKFF